MSSDSGILLVQALYPFTGKNNDELCFKKGDLIVVTQKEEGGWWEGTLSDNTGWFPSNYVKEYKVSEGVSTITDVESPPHSPQQTQQQVVYRTMVSKEIVESEKTHVNELKNIYSKYLTPLEKSDIMSESEFEQLTGNLEEVILVHGRMLNLLEEQFDLPSKEQRIGGTFLKIAPSLQSAHKAYISNHPKAVCIIEKYKDDLNSFMESQGAARPGTLVLTTALSQPFRRLDKYPGVLQELQRHIEESHPDRGDTQRSTHVFRELASLCSSIRRQKQLELEVLTNRINGWEGGESLSVLGEIVHMRSVALLPDNRDRYLVLFPSCLIVLALSSRASSFIFEGKYLLTSIQVSKLEDGPQYKNAFEISGSHLPPIIAVCQSSADQQQWVEILQQTMKSLGVGRGKSSSYGSPPAPPAHRIFIPPSESFFVSRPYAVLTKYFANLYRKGIITKQLLRSLIGIVENLEAASEVVLRTHRSECSLQLNSDASSNLGNVSADNGSSLRHLDVVRRRGKIQNNPGLMTPVLHRKEYHKRNQGNLQKWRHRPLLLKENTLSPKSSDELNCFSSSSSDESDSVVGGNSFLNSGFDYSKSGKDFFPVGDGENGEEVVFAPKGKENVLRANRGPMCRFGEKINEKSNDDSGLDCQNHSNSKSLPTLLSVSKEILYASSEETSTPTNLMSSTVNIPAPTIVISDYVTYISDRDSSSSHNVCNKTIYGSSSEESFSRGSLELRKEKTFPLRSKKALPYYFSSCSGDDERSSADYYEYQRNQSSASYSLSKSEPDIHYNIGSRPSTDRSDSQTYQSHYVEVVKDVDPQKKECKCESHSLRSSDSGLADIINHSENCPLRGETPLGLGRASPCLRLSRCSHSSFIRMGRCVSSSVRPMTPDIASECDSLFLASTPPTQSCTPCTSAPLSCVSDSSVSLLDAASLVSPCTASSTESVYRSGLYAHWWMKASVCPKTLTSFRTHNTLSQIPEKPEVPPKPVHLKPSYHLARSSRHRGRRGTFPAILVPCNKNELENTYAELHTQNKEKGKSSMSHLDLENSTLCRDPSFESQGSQLSQITVIQKSDRNPKLSAVSSSKSFTTLSLNENLTPQLSSTSENNGLSDISSMHSFYESEEGAGEMTFTRDQADEFLVTFDKGHSSRSEMNSSKDAANQTYCSTLNLSFQPEGDSEFFNESRPSVTVTTSRQHTTKLNVGYKSSALPAIRAKSLPQSLFLNTNKGSILPVSHHSVLSPPSNGKANFKPWSLSCLRPSPPLRPGFPLREEKKNVNKLRRKDESWHEDDALILKVIELYCTSAKTRYTVNSSLIDSPPVIIATEEKMIVEETRGNEVVLEEKSLVDTVYALKDQLASMSQNYQELRNEFEREKKLTQSLKNIIDKYLPVNKDYHAISNL